MGASTEIFIILPEYRDSELKNLSHVRLFNDEKYEIETFQNVLNTVEFFKLENFQGYYDSKNVRYYLHPFVELDDYYPDKVTLLRRRVQNLGLPDWRASKEQLSTDVYVFSYTTISDHLLGEVAKRKQLDASKTVLVLSANALYDKRDELVVVIDKTEEIKIKQIQVSTELLADWFVLNRKPERKFHVIPKHGVDGKGADKANKEDDVSVLMCSPERAAELLRYAIPLVNSNKLFNFDEEVGKYIIFHREGDIPQNLYHGYHVEDDKGIPQDIIDKVAQLQKNMKASS